MAESWIECVQRIYREKSANNSSYKLKNAMKDAREVYKKQKGTMTAPMPKGKTGKRKSGRRRGTARRTRRNR